MTQSSILITGKNGKTGARVDQRLQQLGYATRAVSRSTDPSFDWNDRTTWQAAMQGCTSAYVTYQPDLAIPQAEADIRAFIEIAKESGIQHIVLLSGRGEEGAQRAEVQVQQSGLSWNIVRCSWFAQNFSESFLLDGILNGELVLPADDTIEPFIDADDIADVAVACLTKTELHNHLFELTGPRAVSFAQCIEELSEALGRTVKYTQVPIDAYLQALQQQGFPEEMQWLLRELFTVIFDGRNSHVMNGVEEALGRPATDFQAYIAKTLESGVWDQSSEKQRA